MAKFVAGQSGNPAGKPKGARDKRTELRALLQPHAEDLVQKAVELAKAGDVSALRICIDRLIPPLKEDRLAIKLPSLADIQGCRDAQAMVIEAVSKGDLLPAQGEQLSAMIEFQRKGLEGAEIMARLAAIEEKLGIKEVRR